MTTYLVDDESYSTDVLKILLQKYCPLIEVKAVFNDASTALKAIQNEPPQLLFLDIEMPRLNGFDLLKQCENLDFKVIFTTAYNQYAIRAFKFNALDYLLKPIDKEELMKAVEKATVPQKNVLAAIQNLKSDVVPKRIALPIGNELLFVEVDEIICCESEGSYVSVYLINQKKPIILTKSLREFEDILNNPAFFRVHNSHFIHLKYIQKIKKIDGGDIVMTNGRVIPVARSKKIPLMELIVKL